ncbi:putative phospholipid-transporting ATPase IF [Papilio xuthus]|uniref:Phospholipid-transporting ATPase n=1 Tax=Papilio xuthus TaxID=66420 RepID=A0A194PTX9_PAPXU|nr:putative phospholipid-transporting ATPase IF [Papilio xuthus]
MTGGLWRTCNLFVVIMLWKLTIRGPQLQSSHAAAALRTLTQCPLIVDMVNLTLTYRRSHAENEVSRDFNYFVKSYESNLKLEHTIPSESNKVSAAAETRLIEVGAADERSKKKHNKIKTSKYTLLMFLPKNLMEQFRRVVNFYFLIVTVIAVVIDSPVSPFTSIAPLSFMVLVTAMKQGYEDWLRHKADNKVNNQIVETVRNGVINKVRNSSIAPGTLVRVRRGREVPADLVLLCAADGAGKCYVTTANLDGETNLKTLRVPPPLVGYTPDILPHGMRIEVPHPVADLYTFYGRLEIPGQDSLALGTDNLMLRGSRVKNTEWAIGCAVYTGEETKLALNSKYSGNKFSSCESAVNSFLVLFILLLLFEISISMVFKVIIEKETSRERRIPGTGDKVPAVSRDCALFIGWDEELRCEETGRPAIANTSDLNEELGQVEVLFSDKTGTLTKNLMVFKACSIGGRVYEEKESRLYDIERFDEPADTFQTDIKFFFTILALCHSVQISSEDMKKLSARLSGNGNMQLMNFFRRKKLNRGTIGNVNNVNENKPGVLNTIAWNSLLRDTGSKMDYQASSPDEKALVEAADRVGVTFLGEEGNNLVIKVGDDTEMGLRTLAVAYREIPYEEYARVTEAIKRIDGKSASALQQVTLQYRVLEHQLTLVGATAVEDCLQDDVSDTLASLRRAGIRTWVLTGDKVETAINVAQSCSHISENDRRMFLIGVKDELALQAHLEECQRTILEPSYRDLTLIVDGTSMSCILDTPAAPAFVDVSLKCNAVLCCRLSPIQKAKIVKLIKNSAEKPVTAAIGDGANDISMIQEAHVGFGIFGKEGHQAARSADFAFTKFSMVKKMLLVMGHWYYQRLATLIHYFFYKNLVLGNIMLFFQVHSAFSTQSIYDSMYLTLYNLLFTSVPCLVLAVTDQRWPQALLMKNPTLYREIRKNRLMSWWNFLAWLLSSVYHSVLIYGFSKLVFMSSVINTDAKTVDLWCFGAVLFHMMMLVVSLRLWLQARYHTLVFVLTLLLSMLCYVIFNTIYSLFYFEIDGDVLGTYIRLLTSPSFGFLNCLMIVAALAPDYCARYITDSRGLRHFNTGVATVQRVFSTRL